MSEPAKEALFILVDVSESMRPHLEDVKSAIQMVINQKILFHKQDVVGVGVLGSVATNNKVCWLPHRIWALCTANRRERVE